MVVLEGGHPICIMEVKVNAPISVPQLRKYGEFLQNLELAHGRSTALVLLSHVTSAPEGFTDRECDDYGVSLRGAAYWYMVAEWFRNPVPRHEWCWRALEVLGTRVQQVPGGRHGQSPRSMTLQLPATTSRALIQRFRRPWKS